MKTLQVTGFEQPPLFSNKALLRLIVPLLIERLTDITVGIMDAVMVSSAGEAALSGVSLVDTVNNLILFVLAALTTGGAVVISQYMGRSDLPQARHSAKQLIYIASIAGIVLTALLLAFRDPFFRLIYGSIEPDVMRNAQIYCLFTALSFPFAAIANSVAAIYRSMGNSRITMTVSLIMNLINIAGNAIFVYAFHIGAMGVAIATLISRIFSAVVMLMLIRNPRNPIFVDKIFQIRLHGDTVKRILRIGVPSGVENGIFHVGKIMVQSLITTFGTAAIAANAAVGQLSNFSFIPGSAISLAMITVVGQCVGACAYDQVAYYAKRLMLFIYLIQGSLCAILFAFGPSLLMIFQLSDASYTLAVQLLRFVFLFTATIWPMAFPFPNVLRASGDTRFTMTVSIATMWIFRIGLSYVFDYFFALGIMGVYYAMVTDWVARALIFLVRYHRGKWRNRQVI